MQLLAALSQTFTFKRLAHSAGAAPHTNRSGSLPPDRLTPEATTSFASSDTGPRA
jgi:hypothetical protein